jgi:hypothetical protein
MQHSQSAGSLAWRRRWKNGVPGKGRIDVVQQEVPAPQSAHQDLDQTRTDGQFMGGKRDSQPFKGVRKEH